MSTKLEHLEAEQQLERQQAITTPRHPRDERWGFSGIGSLHVQLIHRPAFVAGVCYEIRGKLGNPVRAAEVYGEG